MSLLGLDIGTTGCKAVVFNVKGEIIAQAYREYPLLSPRPEWSELDPNQVWKSTEEVLREIAIKSKKDPIQVLSISSQGEAAVPVGEEGEILGNTPVSFDGRTVEICQEVREKYSPQEMYKITGHAPLPLHTLFKIMWVKRNQAEIYRKAWKFLCYEEFAIFKLGLPPTTDYSLAARTMFLDIRKKRWSEKMLGIGGIDESLLPGVKPSGTVVGEVKREIASSLGLPQGVKVVTGGHDQPMGALGAGVISEGIAMDATGTVECVTPAFKKPLLNQEMFHHNYVCYPHVVPDMYVTLAFNFSGGSLLRWFRDTLSPMEIAEARQTGKDVYDLIVEKASDTPTSILVLPHFTTSGTPYFDPYTRGAILGLTFSATKEDLIKAFLEGITYEIKLNLELLNRAGIEIRELRAIGGGAKSPKWLQIKADIFNKRVLSLHTSEAACLGGAILGGVAIGIFSSISEAVEEMVKARAIYKPNPEIVGKYQRRFEIYSRIYPALKELNHQIGRLSREAKGEVEL